MEEERTQPELRTDFKPRNRWLPVVAALLFCVGVASIIYAFREQRFARRLAASNAEMSATLSQVRGQVEALNLRLTEMTSQPAARPISAASQPAAAKARHPVSQAEANRRKAEDLRWKQVQAKLAEHQQQIEKTEQDVEKTRADLEGNLNSTRQELGGTIARTHDELVALEKRGERNYFEFDLTKSKRFERVGSISLSLRNTNIKHGSYDLAMLVDDIQLAKKRVNLFEPVFFYPADSRQPLELVVNRIDKNRVHGYVSEPKYKESASAESAPGSPGASPSSSPASLPHRPEDLH